MSELTITVIRLGLLVLLWLFVFSVVGVLRGDLYGNRRVRRPGRAVPAAGGGAAAASRAAAPPVAAAAGATPPSRQPRKPSKRLPQTLVITQGTQAGRSVPLTDAGVLLGRNPECTLVLEDDFASGRHARLYPGPEGWVVEDLGSTNGTFVDGTRLTTSRVVRPGTTIRIGATHLELRR